MTGHIREEDHHNLGDDHILEEHHPLDMTTEGDALKKDNKLQDTTSTPKNMW